MSILRSTRLRVRRTRPPGMSVLLIPAQLLAITFKVALHLAQTVPAKFFAHRSRQRERQHRFANHASRRDRRDVRTLKRRRLFLFGIDINGTQRTPQSRKRFQVTANAYL